MGTVPDMDEDSALKALMLLISVSKGQGMADMKVQSVWLACKSLWT